MVLQETVLFIGGKTDRLLLGAEMMEMMKAYKDGNQREFTVRDIGNFRGGGKSLSLSLWSTICDWVFRHNCRIMCILRHNISCLLQKDYFSSYLLVFFYGTILQSTWFKLYLAENNSSVTHMMNLPYMYLQGLSCLQSILLTCEAYQYSTTIDFLPPPMAMCLYIYIYVCILVEHNQE